MLKPECGFVEVGVEAVVALLAKRLHISAEEAYTLFSKPEYNRGWKGPASGMCTIIDGCLFVPSYIEKEAAREVREKNIS